MINGHKLEACDLDMKFLESDELQAPDELELKLEGSVTLKLNWWNRLKLKWIFWKIRNQTTQTYEVKFRG